MSIGFLQQSSHVTILPHANLQLDRNYMNCLIVKPRWECELHSTKLGSILSFQYNLTELLMKGLYSEPRKSCSMTQPCWQLLHQVNSFHIETTLSQIKNRSLCTKQSVHNMEPSQYAFFYPSRSKDHFLFYVMRMVRNTTWVKR